MSGVNITGVKTRSGPARDHYHHGDLRNALLETALRLVAERGPEGFSLREAAREVGVSPGAAYRHFADKQAIMGAIAAEGNAHLAAAMEKAAARAPGAPGSKAHAVAAMAAIAEGYVDFAVKHPSHFRVMFGPWCPEAAPAPDDRTGRRGAFQVLVDALDALVTTGVIDAPARVGAEIACWAGVHGLAGLVVGGSLPLSPRQRSDAVRLLARRLLLGLGCDPSIVPAPSAPLHVDPRQAPPGRRSPGAR